MPAWSELQKPPLEAQRYLSPFTIKYGSSEMHAAFSEINRALALRDVWIATAFAQMKAGIVTIEQYQDLVKHRGNLDIMEMYRRELDRTYDQYNGHDVKSASEVFAEAALVGGPIIGKGETSEDGLSNAEMKIVIREAIPIIEKRIDTVLGAMGPQIRKYKSLVCMGWTHMQAAEPTTVGYRLARYAQSLLTAKHFLGFVKQEIRGKGIKGAVGTSASFVHMLEGTGMSAEEHEKIIMEQLGIPAALITGQTYPRDYIFLAVAANASIGIACNQFAGDLKLLQSSPFGEWAQPERRGQVGSFAMPHKKNPEQAEGVKSLVIDLAAYLQSAFLVASGVTLERGMEDSASKRSFLPESYLAADECLTRVGRLVGGLQVFEHPIGRNMATFGPFVAMEIVLSELSKNPDVNRQEMHERLRVKATEAYTAVQLGNPNPLQQLVALDGEIGKYLTAREIESMFEAVGKHVGDAPERCDKMADLIEQELAKTT